MMDKVQATRFKGAGVPLPGASIKVKGEFRDPRSPYQLADGGLSICLVGVIDSGRDITVVKMQEQKDHRELQIASARALSASNGSQYDKKAVVPVETQKLADRVYFVSSSQPLSDGEFILLTQVPDLFAVLKSNTDGALAGYDFGKHAIK